jgi:23S rRNA pseudouridine1911/1915/1917 synthase
MKQEHFIADDNERLDIFLSKKIDASRSAISHLIKKNAITLNDRAVEKPGQKLRAGDRITVTFPKAEATPAAKLPDFDVPVLYEDDAILVINKPSGVVVHPAPSYKEPTLVDWLKQRGISLSTLSGEERHGIVHRIDKETSGAMVIAKTNEAHRLLSEQLKDRSMGRYYLAVIDLPLKESCIVDAPIARNPANRLKMGIVSGGKTAKSAFAKLALSTNEKHELIAAKLFSGRTHQIRVHLASLQRHILGDGLYGYKGNDSKIGRVFLHAYLLYLNHPTTGKPMHFRAELPADFVALLDREFHKEILDETITTERIADCFRDLVSRV